VSPAALAASEGNAANIYPFQMLGRYQQVHADLRGAPLRVIGLEFRRDGLLPGSDAERRLDCEIWMSEGSYERFSPVLDRNHETGRQVVLARRQVDLPRLTRPTTPPAPFTVALPFDVPFAYGGVADLVWELRIHANTGTSVPYQCDAWRADAATTDVDGSDWTRRGTGCTVAGNVQPMTAGASVRTFLAANQISITLWALNAPRSQPSFLWLGVQETDLPIPGLCASFRVGGNPILLTGATDADGTCSWQTTLPFDASLVNGTAMHQVLTLDPRRVGPLPVSASDLAIWTIPARPAGGGAPRAARAWNNGNVAGVIGTMDAMNFTLVTGFTR
jgi:hypothetical protein